VRSHGLKKYRAELFFGGGIRKDPGILFPGPKYLQRSQRGERYGRHKGFYWQCGLESG